ncbi:MAG: energy-coupling factor transporter transmembrane component T [Oscillospiraceae bacterium]|nr:energy-coupling factor transporter transmembrane component T [Oscillospiraceae bacterium]
MLLRHPVYLVISFISSTAYYLKLSGKDGRKTVFRFLLPMLLFVVIINSFFNHYGVTTLFILPSGNNFTFEALVMGIVSGITVVSVIQWFFCCNEVVTEDKFMHIFGRILPKGALVVSMILRFVPLYRRRYKEISQARKCMGLNGTDSFICKMKNTFKNIGILVSWSFENAIETADSMKARGYGLKGRTYYSKIQWHTGDTLALILLVLFDALIIFGLVSNSAYCIYNPYVIINQPSEIGTTYIINELNLTINPFSFLSIVSLIAFTLLCFLPLTIDLKEDIKWHRLQSKI